MRQFIRYCFEEKPLLFCIWAGFFFRIVAVLLSQGIAFGYDHYVYVENAQHLAAGAATIQQIVDQDGGKAFISHGHSLIYLYINTAILGACEIAGIFDPKSKMLILRLLHAMLSMLTIYYCYRITYRLANRKAALAIGILTSMLWFMPCMSVRTLPENVAAVLLLAATYRLAKTRRQTYKFADDIFTGFLMGVSVTFCYNLVLLILGAAISLLLKSGIKRALLLLFGAAISILALEGLTNTLILGTPFYILGEYIRNIISGSNAISGPRSFYMYISILVMIIPLPWGLAGIFGYVKSWKHCFLLFWPVTIYLSVSYLLPNKEEKFMLAILPLFLILCSTGWFRYMAESRFWTTRPRLRKWCGISFFVVNIPMLMLATIAYVRKPQVETMIHLSRHKADISSLMVENSQSDGCKSLPQFFMGKDVDIYILNRQDSEPDRSIAYSSASASPSSREHYIYTERFFHNPLMKEQPQYVIFCGDNNMPERLARMRGIFPQLSYETSFSPSLADIIIEMFNHRNSNTVLHVYRTTQ